MNQALHATNSQQLFKVLPTPVKSQSDKKDYKVIQLQNGLTACLISDKYHEVDGFNTNVADSESSSSSSEESSGSSIEAEEDELENTEDEEQTKRAAAPEQKMAAAALSVGVGSFSDPKNLPGLSHFLEHMVFMGSEKYPEENDFDSFITKRGGSDNASTDSEQTTFYFECLEKHFYKALDKFAQFFISPLMKRETMTREREAIDSEFQMALPSDLYRKEQLLASICVKDCPVNSFAWGNLVTLRDNITDDALYEAVHEYRKRHYSAHRMTVAVQARLPMEVLESYVVDCFSQVPNNELPPYDFSMFTNSIFDTPEFTKIYYIKPVKDLCQVDLTWVLPSMFRLYKSKPQQYVSWLIGDEGKGSLLSYLKEKVWALGIFTGNGDSGMENNLMYSLFTISIVLTEDGLANLNKVIEAVFGYISMLKRLGPQERIFREIQLVEETSFKFANEKPASDVVEELAEYMHLYPSEHYLTGPELYFEYDPQAINKVTEHLKPNNFNIMVSTNNLPNGLIYNKTEPWFNTSYTTIDIPMDWITAWGNATPLPQFALPQPNRFLTQDFRLLPKSEDLIYPRKIQATPLFELWYKKDNKFELPLAFYYYYLITPLSLESAEASCMLDMFVHLLSLQLGEETYPAQFAELTFSITHSDKGLMLKINGYNEKLPILIDLIIKYLMNFESNLTDKMFYAVKDKLLRNYYNRYIKPSALAKELRLKLILNKYWTSMEKYTALVSVNNEMLKVFNRAFIKNLYVKGLVQGNVTEDVVIQTTEKLVNDLNYKSLMDNTYPNVRVVQLPKGERCFKVMSFNENDSNSIITNYYQSGPFTTKSSVLIELIMLLIEEPLFDILRTKEQLGYHVFCTIRDTFGILGYTITVNAQAVKNTTEYVDERMEAFIKYAHKLLKKVSEKKFNHAREDLIKVKKLIDVHLQDEVSRNWSEITSEDYLFDRQEQEIAALKTITVGDIRTWWEKHNMLNNKNNFRKLSIQVVGHDIANVIEKPVDVPENEIEKHVPLTRKANKFVQVKNIRKECLDAATHCSLKILSDDSKDLTKKKGNNYFIKDIEIFKKELFLYPANPKVVV